MRIPLNVEVVIHAVCGLATLQSPQYDPGGRLYDWFGSWVARFGWEPIAQARWMKIAGYDPLTIF